jgi:cytochrome P450
MPGILTSLNFAYAPRNFIERNTRRFGSAYSVGGMHGPSIATSDPEHVRRVFAADSDAFATLSRVSLRELFGEHSVLINAGAVHRRQRKLLAPPLHGPRLRQFGATMQRIADEHVARLHVGQRVRALDFTTGYTLDVIVQTVFGATDASEARVLRALLQELVESIPPIALFVPPLQRSWFPPWARFLKARRRFRDWTQDKIAAVRRSPGEDDVLSLLLQARFDDGSEMDDDEIRDQLATLLLAGHETTAIALAHCISRVAMHPAEAERLRAELASCEDVLRAPYLSAFVDETLRIEPIVTDVARIATRDFALDDQLTLPAGRVVFVMIEGIHLDPHTYPEPLRFRPERFLERKFAPHEYVPFGGGVRRCIGAAFSDLETKIMLATFLRHVSHSLPRGRPDPRVRRNVTMGPKHGVPICIDAMR